VGWIISLAALTEGVDQGVKGARTLWLSTAISRPPDPLSLGAIGHPLFFRWKTQLAKEQLKVLPHLELHSSRDRAYKEFDRAAEAAAAASLPLPPTPPHSVVGEVGGAGEEVGPLETGVALGSR